jgi:hypothetical protein
MAALSASRYSPALKTFHKRLAAADKKSIVIGLFPLSPRKRK